MAAIFIVMVVATVMIYSNDMLKRTRLELETFYQAELSNCEITRVVERQYSGKGTYNLFQTNCSTEYYPILLDKESKYEDYYLFEEGLIVNKKANSVDLSLTGLTSELKLKIRHPSDEDDRFFSLKIVLIFFGTVLVVMVFIPNSFWERKRN
ncbi:MAG: hypothetical protein RIC30_03930 [Marinoscillum sp.]|uniref:hypothetical protein n=1 Tax=Marinoscillum sp. TaxID=2024838 RepID=UPI0032F440E8